MLQQRSQQEPTVQDAHHDLEQRADNLAMSAPIGQPPGRGFKKREREGAGRRNRRGRGALLHSSQHPQAVHDPSKVAM
jgi:hypothetical protein